MLFRSQAGGPLPKLAGPAPQRGKVGRAPPLRPGSAHPPPARAARAPAPARRDGGARGCSAFPAPAPAASMDARRVRVRLDELRRGMGAVGAGGGPTPPTLPAERPYQGLAVLGGTHLASPRFCALGGILESVPSGRDTRRAGGQRVVRFAGCLAAWGAQGHVRPRHTCAANSRGGPVPHCVCWSEPCPRGAEGSGTWRRVLPCSVLALSRAQPGEDECLVTHPPARTGDPLR